ncbi:Uncharacterised protein [Mycoplasmopsis maculosa]|uniref:Uncharacterized protein n=1 Tax=Mycoplasmopsis maculosa TaxID=114885 RepID=A0A449B587_9BACT|nr:hypothetical protein [Mycoplasmopsis maculosa]VEU75760.1 Uncharacterised protein [Mycoplasmopsis maculosa]
MKQKIYKYTFVNLILSIFHYLLSIITILMLFLSGIYQFKIFVTELIVFLSIFSFFTIVIYFNNLLIEIILDKNKIIIKDTFYLVLLFLSFILPVINILVNCYVLKILKNSLNEKLKKLE